MRTTRLLAPLFLAALALAACTSATRPPDDRGSEPAQPVALTSQDINPQSRANLQQGGTMRLAVSSFVANWNPLHVAGRTDDATAARNPLLPHLVLFDASGTYSFDSDYVLSATQTSADPTTVEWKLNPQAVWGDGSPVDGDDMIATWRACNGADKAFQCAITDGYDQIAAITTGADKFDVTVRFKGSYPDWTQPFNTVLKAESVKDPATFNNGWGQLRNDWLSGPFKVSGFDATEKVLTEVPNDKWWGDMPLLDRITFRQIERNQLAKAFADDAIDGFDIGPDPAAYQTASGVPDAAIRKAAGPSFRQITFNSKAGALQDLAIRQAIVRGLDRREIAASDLAGIDWPARPLNNHILLEGQPGYVDEARATGLDYDPQRAKADLDAAGWTVGPDGVRAKDGKQLVVRFTQLQGTPVSANEGLQVQSQLKDIGIKVDLVTAAGDQAFFEQISGHQFELTAFSWFGTPYPYTTISQIYGTGAGYNFAQLSMPEVDDLATRIKQESDPTTRQRLTDQADQIIWRNVHTLPLYQRPELVAVKSKIANWGAFGLGQNAFKWEDVGFLR